MSELKMIWDEVVSMLDLELNNLQLQNWIMPLRPICLKDGVLIVDAKTAFIKNMVSRKYLDSIISSLSYICKKKIQVVLIDPSQNDYYITIDRYKVEESGQVSVSHISEKEDSLPNSFSQGQSRKNANTDEDAQRLAVQLEEQKRKLNQQRDQNGYRTLNPKYTMESFVRGKSNDFAYATAKAVVANPGTIYNPLFIYGLSGLGKTHLMQAIAHSILEEDPTKKVLYITSEKFMNEMIAMIEHGSNQEKENFRTKYRSIDVLLIDDIQFIAGKKATMEEIFHTFNDLKEANKQIVLSSDKPPKELKNLEERLVTRFEWGMTADIQKPDFETRVAILNHKMKGETNPLPRYVLEFIANNSTANIRELEGALLRVIAYFRFKKIDAMKASKDEVMGIARNALKLEEKKEVSISVEDIMEKITEHYQLEKNALLSKSRQNSIAFPRQIAMYLARKLTNQSLVAIGEFFQRDHTTVMHAIDKIESRIKKDELLQEEINDICNELKQL